MIAVIDYGAGNLRSVVNAIKIVGYSAEVTSSSKEIMSADAVILPGVGAAAEAIANLERLGLVELIQTLIKEDKPFLGVCLGLQLLLSETEEGGRHKCLDIIQGKVRKFPAGLKIPHMGWNQVKQKVAHPVFDGVEDNANFYFVHSYYADPEDKSVIAGETEYGVKFCSAIAKGNMVATQFHPEKSGAAGLKIYDNFIRLALQRKQGAVR